MSRPTSALKFALLLIIQHFSLSQRSPWTRAHSIGLDFSSQVFVVVNWAIGRMRQIGSTRYDSVRLPVIVDEVKHHLPRRSSSA